MLTPAVTELWDSLRGSGPAAATVVGGGGDSGGVVGIRYGTVAKPTGEHAVGGKCKRAVESGSPSRYCAGQPEIAPN